MTKPEEARLSLTVLDAGSRLYEAYRKRKHLIFLCSQQRASLLLYLRYSTASHKHKEGARGRGIERGGEKGTPEGGGRERERRQRGERRIPGGSGGIGEREGGGDGDRERGRGEGGGERRVPHREGERKRGERERRERGGRMGERRVPQPESGG